MSPMHSKPNPSKPRVQCKLVVPPIGLLKAKEKKDYAKGKYATVKLRNIPNDPNSMTYDYQVPFVSLELLVNGSFSKPDLNASSQAVCLCMYMSTMTSPKSV